MKKLNSYFISAGLQINEEILTRFVSSLLTKPFVILTGLSGSGKTKLAQAFAMCICQDKKQYSIVPVGSDWTNREPLLGFPNSLDKSDYVKPDNGVLDLIIEAIKEENKDKPYFLILDEMNLSHVERYFADFLSVMESKDSILLHSNTKELNGVPSKIQIPKNLFIIGTVNIDETTYMFSPKVLDRANVIEFRITESDLDKYLNNISNFDLNKLNSFGSNQSKYFVDISNNELQVKNENLNNELKLFFNELKKVGSEFGYRTASEITRFQNVIKKIDSTYQDEKIIDIAVMQKLLPKLHGSRKKLEPVLKSLGTLCLINDKKFDDYISNEIIDFENDSNIKYKISFEKIFRMYQNLISNGFTSYSEA